MKYKTISNHITQTLTVGLSLCLVSCGGGGSSATAPVVSSPQNPVSNSPTWTPGVFAAESQFKDFCASPRSGINPQTNNAYPDKAGTTTQENFWLRSWSNRTYLWYDEITDRDPANTADRLDYFDLLKTTRRTASDNPVDKFHFTQPTSEYQARVSSGASVSYGARFRLIQSSPPRNIVVGYTEAGSPAATAGLLRGDKILEIDGVDAVNGSDVGTLNAGLFPGSEGESHTFLVQATGGTAVRTVTLSAGTVTSAPVHTSKIITRSNGDKVAYVLFNTFGTSIAEEAIVNTVTNLQAQNISDLVLDLRYNGGGFLDISSELAYMIAGDAATNGAVYETLVFNDKHPTTNPVTGRTLSPTPFHKRGQGFTVSANTALPTLTLPRVYVLSTAGTCSASESLINSLEGINVEVVLIGTTTCGKPYGFYATDNCGETYFTIQFRGENDKGFGDYSDGFSPRESGTVVGEAINGCVVDDDFTKPLGDETEAQLSAALHHIENGTCPAAAATAKTEKVWGKPADQDDELSLLSDPKLRARLILESSRILNHPSRPAQ